MLINVYDDHMSIVHFIICMVLPIVPWLFLIIIAYEVIEFHLKKWSEPVQNFLGDLYEVSFGCMIGTLLYSAFGLI